MLFHVRMDVRIPHDLDADVRAELVARERSRAQELQRDGVWLHLWRIVGKYSNISVFEVPDTAQLHELLSGLPLFSYMDVEVTALTRHPSDVNGGS